MALQRDGTKSKGVYKSKKALGIMYRAAIKASPSPTVASSSTLQHWSQLLLVPGYEAYLPYACRMRDTFNAEVELLLSIYGVATEAELLSGRVASFNNSLVAQENPREVEESLRRAVRELWSWGRELLRRGLREAQAHAAPEAREHVNRLVASAWYAAGTAASSAATADAHPRVLCSFAWVAWPELLRLLAEASVVPAAQTVAPQPMPDRGLPFVKALKIAGYDKAAAFEAMDVLDIHALGWTADEYASALAYLSARPNCS